LIDLPPNGRWYAREMIGPLCARAIALWSFLWLGLTAAHLLGPGEAASVPMFVVTFALLGAAVVWMGLRATSLPRAPSTVLGAVGVALALPVTCAVADVAAAPAALVCSLSLWIVGSWLGAALGRGMRDPAHLWPLVVVAVGADTWSVLAADGLTAALVEGRAPIALNWLAVHLPVPGIGPSPLLGLGDLVFVGFLAGACTQVDLSRRRTAVGLGLGLGLCLVALVVTAQPLPALPFIGPLVAAAHGRRVRPRARELGLGLVVAVLPWLVGR
jgi:hypothetical protein